jgi:hypothetical protein
MFNNINYEVRKTTAHGPKAHADWYDLIEKSTGKTIARFSNPEDFMHFIKYVCGEMMQAAVKDFMEEEI